jgi:hypothetical protein
MDNANENLNLVSKRGAATLPKVIWIATILVSTPRHRFLNIAQETGRQSTALIAFPPPNPERAAALTRFPSVRRMLSRSHNHQIDRLLITRAR